MSIEDINYMKAHSIKQAYTFIIDSSDRDRNMYPNPNDYVINFSTPFKNIIGLGENICKINNGVKNGVSSPRGFCDFL